MKAVAEAVVNGLAAPASLPPTLLVARSRCTREGCGPVKDLCRMMTTASASLRFATLPDV